MRKTTPRPRVQMTAPSGPNPMLTSAQQSKMYWFQTVLGLGIIGVSVLIAVVLCAKGQLPFPVVIGLTLLALFRFYALKQEWKRQKAEQA